MQSAKSDVSCIRCRSVPPLCNSVVKKTLLSSFPELHTPRLHLRKMQVEDVPALVKYADNKNISDYILNMPYPYREPDAVLRIRSVLEGFKNKTRYVFAVISKERAEMIGEVSLHLDRDASAQLGYWIGEPFWGQGLATEAAGAVVRFGLETLGLERIFATFDAENGASERVLVKCGLKRVGVTGDLVQYGVNKEEM